MKQAPPIPPPHVLQLGMSWFPEQAGNGLDRVYHALVRHLPRAGVDISGLVAGSQDVSRTSGGVVHAFAPDTAPLPRRMLALRRNAHRMLNETCVDLVATHFALYTFPILDLLGSRPLVVHFHGPWAGESDAENEHAFIVKAKAVLERAVYRRGARFIVLSEAFRDVLITQYGIAEEQIRVVPGGVDVKRFDTGLSRREARLRLGWPIDRPLVLSVRRLVRRVGLENLVDGMQAVRERHPAVLLLIAGTGPLADVLQARIQAAGLERHVRLLGFVPDEELPLAYRAADLSVVPTTALEGFGLIAVESLAAGTPVLVASIGGLPEVVRDLSDRLLLPGTAPGMLAEYVSAALSGSFALPSADACQAYARTRFAWPNIATQVQRVYEEVL